MSRTLYIVWLVVTIFSCFTFDLQGEPPLRAYLDTKTIAVLEIRNLEATQNWVLGRAFFPVLENIVKTEKPDEPSLTKQVEVFFSHPLVKLMSKETVMALVPLKEGKIWPMAFLAITRVGEPAFTLVKDIFLEEQKRGDIVSIKEKEDLFIITTKNRKGVFCLVYKDCVIASNELSVAEEARQRIKEQKADFSIHEWEEPRNPDNIMVVFWVNCEPIVPVIKDEAERDISFKEPMSQLTTLKIVKLLEESKALTFKIEIEKRGISSELKRHLKLSQNPWQIYSLPLINDKETVAALQLALPFKEIYDVIKRNMVEEKPFNWEVVNGILSGLTGGYDFEKDVLPLIGNELGIILRSPTKEEPDFPQLILFLKTADTFEARVRPALEALFTGASLGAMEKIEVPLLWKRYYNGTFRISSLHFPSEFPSYQQLGKLIHPAITCGYGYLWLVSEESFFYRLAQSAPTLPGKDFTWFYMNFERLASLLDHHSDLIISDEVKKGYKTRGRIEEDFKNLIAILKCGEALHIFSKHTALSDSLAGELVIK